MIVSREQSGDYGFLLCAQGTFCKQAEGDLVENTQIIWFSRQSGGEGWSGRVVAQQRPRVSKLGLKGLSDYHSNETAVQAVRQGTIGLTKRATLTTCLLKKGKLENSSMLD